MACKIQFSESGFLEKQGCCILAAASPAIRFKVFVSSFVVRMRFWAKQKRFTLLSGLFNKGLDD